MNNQLRIQILSTIGIIVFVPMLYWGLLNGQETLAFAGVVVFGVCMMLTPLMRLLAKRN